MELQDEIKESIKNIDTKYLVMSLREILSMYEDGELKINPIYQRGFRWNVQQKTYLIESLLLNFPLPPIFVYQREDGIWELVDGLQRISTILEFFNKLLPEHINEENKLIQLERGKFLTKLKGVTPANFHNEYKENSIRMKKYPIHVVIIDAIENGINNSNFEYEVFRRLNTYGSRLSRQEIRNVTLALRDKSLYEKMEEFVKKEIFKKVFSFSKSILEERKDLEVILQFHLLYNIAYYKSQVEKAYDLYDVLDDISISISMADLERSLLEMEKFLEYIYDIIQEESYSFKVYENNKFSQGYQNHIFEILVLLYFKDKNKITIDFIKKIKSYAKWRKDQNISNVKGHRRVLAVLQYVESL